MARLTKAQYAALDLENFFDAQHEARTIYEMSAVAPRPRDDEELIAADLVGSLMGATSTLIER
jgi:hypothetical protein